MNVAALCLLLSVLALAAPATAAADPSLRASPDQGDVGDDVTLNGRGWFSGGGCAGKVTLYFRQGNRRMKLGQAALGGGRFSFDTHYQQAEPGGARFVARQDCGRRTYSRSAQVTIGRLSETVRYRGQTEHGGRVSFVVVDGNEVRKFRVMNRCSQDRRLGSLVPGRMPIGDVSFSRRGREFRIYGRFRPSGRVNGNARQQVDSCDSGKMSWTARRVD